MELQVTQENLSRALSNVARVATGRTTLPILSNILFKIIDNRLSISATNLDIAVTEYIGAKVSKTGSTTIPARLTQDFVSNLPNGTITIKQTDHKIHITSKNYDSTINGIPADEFPVMPAIQKGVAWKIPAKELKHALQQTVFAASADEARPVLTGVLLHTKNKELYIAATDSYRLAEKRVGKINQDTSILVPASALQELLRIIQDRDETVTITHDDQQVLFAVGATELVARLIEGNYPDYQKLIPENFSTSATLNRSELISITKVSGLFAREAAGSITIKVDDTKKSLSVRSIASQVGENTASAEAKAVGAGEITLNSRYLLDALNAIDGETVSFSFNGKLDPIVVAGLEDKSYTHIVMPLKS